MKSFLIFKAKEQKTDKSPSHNIVVFEGEEDNRKSVYVGVCWAKQSKSGESFLSCKLQDEDKEYHRKGYKLVEDRQEEIKEEVEEEIVEEDFI